MDQILSAWPRPVLWLPFVRDLAIGSVFYHELGHHVHLFIRSEYREKEDVADDWRNKLMANYIRKQYWYLIPAIKMLRVFRRKSKAARSRMS